ncbi:MAG: LysR family transcriptional regulator [Gammaproteobacteria bacterium]|nr:LysR family transcriptional regulator [Gammaproteobacteria bacterium]MDH5777216.1 LysR family transcriptional regulator [Gammaproteobacteria bacterium]
MEYTNLPDLTGWATLRAVVEEGGVSEAARRLRVSQSAISKRLKQLEDCYGVPLMERVGGRLRMTPAGEKVYMLATLTLDRQVSLREEISALSEGKKNLRMNVTFAIGEHLLPDLLLQFKEKYPDYRIDFQVAYSRQIQRDLAMERVDMALVEAAPDHPDILVQKWLDDELWLVCAPDHPLFGTDFLPLDELGQQQYVLREKRSSIRESLDEALQSIGMSDLNISLEVGSSETVIELVERGKYVTFLPRFVVNERVETGELFHIKVAGFRIFRILWIARNRAALDHPVAEAFIEMIRV